jgi:3-methyladenine DNA glycosylase AlkD
MLTNEELRTMLYQQADKKYAAFSGKLLPPGTRLIGVRLPALRCLARQLAADRAEVIGWLSQASDDFFEERMLQGLVIGALYVEFFTRIGLIRSFLPKIDNWSICDSCCASLKCLRPDREQLWPFLMECLASPAPYTQRFAVVMLLDHYADKEYAPKALAAFDAIQTGHYYVKMAIAWAVSVYFIKAPDITRRWLPGCRLDAFTRTKALQKAIESYRVTNEDKVWLRVQKHRLSSHPGASHAQSDTAAGS